jgi:hypothetical protein
MVISVCRRNMNGYGCYIYMCKTSEWLWLLYLYACKKYEWLWLLFLYVLRHVNGHDVSVVTTCGWLVYHCSYGTRIVPIYEC